MKKNAVSILIIAGLLSVFLSGCRASGRMGGGEGTSENAHETMSENVQENTQGSVSENITQNSSVPAGNTEGEKTDEGPPLPYQFVRRYGIIRSDSPIYELDTVVEWKIPQKEKEVFLPFALRHEQELIVNVVLDDYSEVGKIAAGEEPPENGEYFTLSDGTMITSGRYQNELWTSGEGLFLTGPGIPKAGIKPLESMYVSYPAYFEAYGNRRYFIKARFEIPSALGSDTSSESVSVNALSGYAIRVLDFEKPLEFTLERVPEYGTLEELAEKENGSMDTHDGISIISMGEREEEGLLVSWYVYSEGEERPLSIIYKPPYQEIDMPVISSGKKQYPIKQLAASPYWDSVGSYRLSDIKRYGRHFICLFDVPVEEQNASFRMNIPGVTFLEQKESSEITLPVPEDYEEVNTDILWEEGSVRILGITRMKEPQIIEIPDEKGGFKVRERPAVYIDVEAGHEEKKLALKRLFCERKLRWTGWERERYDFDETGSLSGFRVFYDDGDTEVTLKFLNPAFYWEQPYVMELPLTD